MGFRDKFKNADHALTFNDVLLLPGWTTIEPSEADVRSRVTRSVELDVPFVSSPMDTVTESEMAIALARHGGLGVLHRNCSVEEEVEMARLVKRAEALIIRDVVTVRPDATIDDLLGLMETKNIHGFPVVNGDGSIVGIVTWRDFRLADHNLKVEDVMTKEVITAGENTTLEEAKAILHEHRIEKLPIVDDAKRVRGLITMKDITLKGLDERLVELRFEEDVEVEIPPEDATSNGQSPWTSTWTSCSPTSPTSTTRTASTPPRRCWTTSTPRSSSATSAPTRPPRTASPSWRASRASGSASAAAPYAAPASSPERAPPPSTLPHR